MIEYSDFQYPYCGKAAMELLPALRREYADTGRVALAFKHLPLDIHPHASNAAAAAQCAGEQGKFWAAHDSIFADVTNLTDQALRARVAQVGLDVARYDACRDGPMARSRVDVDKAEASALGITATPTFLIGRVEGDGVRVLEIVTGMKRLETFKQVLDELLNR